MWSSRFLLILLLLFGCSQPLINKAKSEGASAFKAGLLLLDNPYQDNWEAKAAWQDGWCKEKNLQARWNVP